MGRRVLRGVATSLALLGIVGAATVAYYYKDIESRLTKVTVDVAKVEGGVINMLVLGSDSRNDITTKDDRGKFGPNMGQRADTIMLVQVDTAQARASILSFPRDLYVRIAGTKGRGKINSSYARGPQGVVDTLQGLTGVPINHYVEIGFLGFREVVDTIGGVDVCLDKKLNDPQLKFKFPAGPNHLNGDDALNFVRSRYADTDFDRIKRQQQFLSAVVNKVGQPAVLANPVRLNGLAQAFATNVTTDQSFQLRDILKVARNVRSIGVDSLKSFSVPGKGGSVGGASVVYMDQTKAQLLFKAFREQTDPGLAFAPHVVLLDASGRAVIDQAARDFEARGFIVDAKEQASISLPETKVTYPTAMAEDARTVNAQIVGSELQRSSETKIRVVLGVDYAGLIAVPSVAPVASSPAPRTVC